MFPPLRCPGRLLPQAASQGVLATLPALVHVGAAGGLLPPGQWPRGLPPTAVRVCSRLARTAGAAAEGRFERFKTTNGFDGTAKNPTWLGAADKGPG